MAWTAPTDRLTGDVITAAQWNTFLGLTGDLSMTAAAIVTTNGDMVYATGANTLVRRAIGSTGQVLTVAGGIPTWATASTSDVVLVGSSTAATSTTSTSAVDLVTISGLSILVTQGFQISHNCRKQALAANSVAFGLKLNSTVVVEAANVSWCASSGTNRAENGWGVVSVFPRSSADYLANISAMSGWRVSATGAEAAIASMANVTLSALLPNATITSIAIRAINLTANNAAEVTSIRILTGSY